ncbi:Uncharacterized protein TCM_014553 [Theobroma cacao]|uniref:Uncharacterized protein n=1 Tax=Theobroma cacao TaxID=3641 RepID=A0A061FXU6_THECC|nr:Uncharacterized protein TCM_014553 [Theobroma cacao]
MHHQNFPLSSQTCLSFPFPSSGKYILCIHRVTGQSWACPSCVCRSILPARKVLEVGMWWRIGVSSKVRMLVIGFDDSFVEAPCQTLHVTHCHC